MNCAAFDELRSIWSIAQHTCNKVGVRVSSRIRVSFRVRVRLAQLAKSEAMFDQTRSVFAQLAQSDQMHLTDTSDRV